MYKASRRECVLRVEMRKKKNKNKNLKRVSQIESGSVGERGMRKKWKANLNSSLDSTAQTKSRALVLLHVLKVNMMANVFTKVYEKMYKNTHISILTYSESVVPRLTYRHTHTFQTIYHLK